MKRLLTSLFAVALGATALADPKADANALLLPTYVFERQPPVSAGFAFIFEEGGQRFAATAYHVFGPSGGLRSRLSPRQVSDDVKALAGICLGDGNTVVVAQPALFVEGARAVDSKGAEADVTLFRVPDTRAKAALRLATMPAKTGARVWLFARLIDRAEPRLYPAKLIEVTPKVLRYEFENAELNLAACSGAPVLDEFGVVAAMHLGYLKKEGVLSGIAAPAAAVRERLAAATAGER
jgi:hypothetical protein